MEKRIPPLNCLVFFSLDNAMQYHLEPPSQHFFVLCLNQQKVLNSCEVETNLFIDK